MDEICGYSIEFLKEIGVIDREFGDYLWDHWKAAAVKSGVSEDVAQLGWNTLREKWGHMWEGFDTELDQDHMIKLALEFPEYAKLRWEWLIISDGELALQPGYEETFGQDVIDQRIPEKSIQEIKQQGSFDNETK